MSFQAFAEIYNSVFDDGNVNGVRFREWRDKFHHDETEGTCIYGYLYKEFASLNDEPVNSCSSPAPQDLNAEPVTHSVTNDNTITWPWAECQPFANRTLPRPRHRPMQEVSQKRHWIACGTCQCWFHTSCVKIAIKDFKKYENIDWFCTICT